MRLPAGRRLAASAVTAAGKTAGGSARYAATAPPPRATTSETLVAVVDIDRPVAKRAQERVSRGGRDAGGVPLELLCDGVAERVLVQLVPAGPDDLEAVRKLPRGVKRGERRQEVAAGEVAAGAEENRASRSPLAHPANSRTGSPVTPGTARKSEPARGSSSGVEVFARRRDEELIEAAGRRTCRR